MNNQLVSDMQRGLSDVTGSRNSTQALSTISAIRHGGRWLQSIAWLVTITFTMLILAPTAEAVHAELDRPPALPPATAEAQFSDHMVELTERIKHWRKALDPNGITKMHEAERGRAQLARLRSDLSVLDRQVRDSLRQSRRALEERELDALILEREQETASHYEQKYAELEQLLAELQGARGADEIQALDDLIAFLDANPSGRPQAPFDPNNLPFLNLQPLPDHRPRLQAEAYASDFPDVVAVMKGEPVVDPEADPDTTAATPSSPTEAGDENKPSSMPSADPTPRGSDPNAFDDPQWLSTSDEIVLTDAIQAKAAELDNNPVTIYHWVRNNIEWIPTWGAQQDADITLGSQRGNAFDQASLLIALLRAANIPARYAQGVIEVEADRFRNWTGGFEDIDSAVALASSGGIPLAPLTSGGAITKVQLEHVWVEAALDYIPSQGAVNRTPDSWVPLDPSFKQYEFLEGLDPIEIAGINAEQLAQDFVDSGTVNEAESWVTGFDPTILENAQNQIQTELETYIENNLTDPTVGEVIGGRQVIIQEFPAVPANLANPILITGLRYAEVPTSLQQQLTLGFGISVSGFPINPITLPWSTINNRKLTLSFAPATPADEQALAALIPDDAQTIDDLPTTISSNIRVLPELKHNGELIHRGTSALKLGEEMMLFKQAIFPGRGAVTRPLSTIAGSYLAIGSESGSISVQNLQELQQKVEETKATLETEDPDLIQALNREDLLGDLFYAGMLGYYGQLSAFSALAGQQQKGYTLLLGGLGTHGYEPKVNTLFGFPRSISPGGVVFDIPIAMVNLTDGMDQGSNRKYQQQIGQLGSALEHIMPEQLFSSANPQPEAISTVNALSKANAEGQRIYKLTNRNMVETLPNLNLDIETEAAIEQAIRAGLEVFAHTDSLSIPGWNGAGYAVLNPLTGSGAYLISGGMNGGFIDVVGTAITSIAYFIDFVISIEATLGLRFPQLEVVVQILNILSFTLEALQLGQCDLGSAFILIFALFTVIAIAYTQIAIFLFNPFVGFLVGIGFDFLVDYLLNTISAVSCGKGLRLLNKKIIIKRVSNESFLN